MNIVSEITDFQYQILLSTAYIECFKHHINAFDDFGQFASNDNDDDQKPFSAYSKYFDECSLSSEEAVTLKSFEPFQRDDDQIPWYTKIFWVGSENWCVETHDIELSLPISWDNRIGFASERDLGLIWLFKDKDKYTVDCIFTWVYLGLSWGPRTQVVGTPAHSR